MNGALIASVFVGGGLGSVARHFSVLAADKFFNSSFAYGTLIVNIVGCFIIGALMESFALKLDAPAEMRALLVTGFLGGFTTFSAFSFDFYKMIQTGQALQAAAYVVASVFFSLLAVFAGVYLIRGVFTG